jgi:hypothetical protein
MDDTPHWKASVMTPSFFSAQLRAVRLSFVLASLSACAPATRAALIPQLDIGARSLRSGGSTASNASLRSSRRWDVTLFARLVWRSRRSDELIPTRRSLVPEAWDAVCADPQCDFRDPAESDLTPWLSAEP